MSSPTGYTSRDLIFNNPAYQPWPKRPVGQITFPRFTKVSLLKPTNDEMKRLRQIAQQAECDAFTVKLEGRRVFLTRDALLTEEEYHEVRCSEAALKNDKAGKQRSKLALLKDRSRDMG